MEPTFELSQEYVPVKTSELKNSGYLEVVRYRDGARAEIGYARGGNPDYAIYVHEIEDFYHVPPTSHKFLERAIDEDWYQLLNRLAAATKRASGI